MVDNERTNELFEKMRAKGKDNRYAIVRGEDSNHTLAPLEPVMGC